MSVEDRDLIRSCLRGNRQSYRALLRKYQDPVVNYCQRMIRDAEKYLRGKNIQRFGLLVDAANLKLHQELQKGGYLINDDLLFMYRRSSRREGGNEEEE